MGKLKHGEARRGQQSRTWRLWQSMMRRCYRPSQDSYAMYGGKGITVHERWHTYSNFLADVGECPDGLSIDRKDNAKGYEPGNVRWATMRDQQRNRTNNRVLVHSGKSMPLVAWAEEIGVKPRALWMRIYRYGWSVEKALTTPSRTNAGTCTRFQ